MTSDPLLRVRALALILAGTLGGGMLGLALTDRGASPVGLIFLLLITVAGLAELYRYADGIAVLAGMGGYAWLEQGRADGLVAWIVAAVVLLSAAVATRLLRLNLHLLQEREQQVRQVVEDLTIRDPISHLLKPAYGELAIDEEVQRARRTGTDLSLVLMSPDLAAGGARSDGDADAALLGAVFRDVLRGTDRGARLGPTLFAAILPHTGPQGAGKVANKLRVAALERGNDSVRAGVATFPQNAVSAEELREEAEVALELARSANLPVVSPDMLEL